jgi:N-terminal region of glycosyl transferase group 7
LTFSTIAVGDLTSHNSTLLTTTVIENENTHRYTDLQIEQPKYAISIIIPVYNEESKITSLLTHIKDVLSETLLDYELILINI